MSPLDRSVAIERVRVVSRVLAEHDPAPVFIAGYLGVPAGAAPHDQRIVIRELHIDVEAELDDSAARRLAKELAWSLARRLAELQDERSTARLPPGPIHVETLRVHLRGELERHPPTHQISAAMMDAFEAEVRDV